MAWPKAPQRERRAGVRMARARWQGQGGEQQASSTAPTMQARRMWAPSRRSFVAPQLEHGGAAEERELQSLLHAHRLVAHGEHGSLAVQLERLLRHKARAVAACTAGEKR